MDSKATKAELREALDKAVADNKRLTNVLTKERRAHAGVMKASKRAEHDSYARAEASDIAAAELRRANAKLQKDNDILMVSSICDTNPKFACRTLFTDVRKLNDRCDTMGAEKRALEVEVESLKAKRDSLDADYDKRLDELGSVRLELEASVREQKRLGKSERRYRDIIGNIFDALQLKRGDRGMDVEEIAGAVRTLKTDREEHVAELRRVNGVLRDVRVCLRTPDKGWVTDHARVVRKERDEAREELDKQNASRETAIQAAADRLSNYCAGRWLTCQPNNPWAENHIKQTDIDTFEILNEELSIDHRDSIKDRGEASEQALKDMTAERDRLDEITESNGDRLREVAHALYGRLLVNDETLVGKIKEMRVKLATQEDVINAVTTKLHEHGSYHPNPKTAFRLLIERFQSARQATDEAYGKVRADNEALKEASRRETAEAVKTLLQRDQTMVSLQSVCDALAHVKHADESYRDTAERVIVERDNAKENYRVSSEERDSVRSDNEYLRGETGRLTEKLEHAEHVRDTHWMSYQDALKKIRNNFRVAPSVACREYGVGGCEFCDDMDCSRNRSAAPKIIHVLTSERDTARAALDETVKAFDEDICMHLQQIPVRIKEMKAELGEISDVFPDKPKDELARRVRDLHRGYYASLDVNKEARAEIETLTHSLRAETESRDLQAGVAHDLRVENGKFRTRNNAQTKVLGQISEGLGIVDDIDALPGEVAKLQQRCKDDRDLSNRATAARDEVQNELAAIREGVDQRIIDAVREYQNKTDTQGVHRAARALEGGLFSRAPRLLRALDKLREATPQPEAGEGLRNCDLCEHGSAPMNCEQCEGCHRDDGYPHFTPKHRAVKKGCDVCEHEALMSFEPPCSSCDPDNGYAQFTPQPKPSATKTPAAPCETCASPCAHKSDGAKDCMQWKPDLQKMLFVGTRRVTEALDQYYAQFPGTGEPVVAEKRNLDREWCTDIFDSIEELKESASQDRMDAGDNAKRIAALETTVAQVEETSKRVSARSHELKHAWNKSCLQDVDAHVATLERVEETEKTVNVLRRTSAMLIDRTGDLVRPGAEFIKDHGWAESRSISDSDSRVIYSKEDTTPKRD